MSLQFICESGQVSENVWQYSDVNTFLPLLYSNYSMSCSSDSRPLNPLNPQLVRNSSVNTVRTSYWNLSYRKVRITQTKS